MRGRRDGAQREVAADPGARKPAWRRKALSPLREKEGSPCRRPSPSRAICCPLRWSPRRSRERRSPARPSRCRGRALRDRRGRRVPQRPSSISRCSAARCARSRRCCRRPPASPSTRSAGRGRQQRSRCVARAPTSRWCCSTASRCRDPAGAPWICPRFRPRCSIGWSSAGAFSGRNSARGRSAVCSSCCPARRGGHGQAEQRRPSGRSAPSASRSTRRCPPGTAAPSSPCRATAHRAISSTRASSHPRSRELRSTALRARTGTRPAGPGCCGSPRSSAATWVSTSSCRDRRACAGYRGPRARRLLTRANSMQRAQVACASGARAAR